MDPTPSDTQPRLTAALTGRYRLDRELGAGGMATVYLAHDLRHDRQVALKVLRPELAAAIGADRFLAEIRTTANLQHPHILPLFDSGAAAGLLFYVMPYVEGESLRARIARETQLSVDAALEIAAEVAGALEAAHTKGVVHRDIKPENIMLTGGHALVADFGIAKAVDVAGDRRLTETGLVIGTPAYMSPEQASGERTVDSRSDVYALGCVLYEMLAGEPPFTGPTAQAVIAKRFSGDVPSVRRGRPGVAETIDRMISKALAPVPSDRWQSAEAFRRAIIEERSSASAPPPGPTKVAPRARRPMLLGSVLALIAVLGIWSAFHFSRASQPAAAIARTIAVLPLVNVGGDSTQEFFADGMTDELTSTLGKIPGLRVAARSSAFVFKGQSADARDVGARLHVASVLEGSVRRAGSQIRVSAQLINAADGLALWSETYERAVANTFEIQDDIAKAVAAALRLTLGAAARRAVGDATVSVEAHDLYLQGRYAFNTGTEAGLRKSLRLYEQALSVDSTYAPAWLGIAVTWSYLADDVVAPREGYPIAKAAALKAIALDPDLAEAHAIHGAILAGYDWDRAASAREVSRALELNPSSADAWHYSGISLPITPAGTDSAVVMLRHAAMLDPLSAGIVGDISLALVLGKRYAEAATVAREAIQLDSTAAPAYECLGMSLRALGRPEEALTAFDTAARLGYPADADAIAVLMMLGKRSEALTRFDRLKATAQQRYVSGDRLALGYLATGDTTAAFHWLDVAYRQRSAMLGILHALPAWEGMREDPRFIALVRKVGVAGRQ